MKDHNTEVVNYTDAVFRLIGGINSPVAVNLVRGEKTLGVRHSHTFYELAMVIDGTGSYWFQGDTYTLNPGDIFLLPPNTAHEYLSQNHLVVANFLWFPDQLLIPIDKLIDTPGFRAFFQLEPSSRSSFKFEHHLILSPEATGAMLNYHKKLTVELREQQPGFQFKCSCLLAEAIIAVCRYYTAANRSSNERSGNELQRMEKVLNFLENNYMNHIGRLEAARIYGSSEPTFFRKFKEVMNESFTDYLINLRLRHAHTMLLHSKLPISEIALRCGFCDSNYFCYRFRKKFNMPPLRFRRQY